MTDAYSMQNSHRQALIQQRTRLAMSSNFTIYHNPRCSKSRQTLNLLKENGIEPVVVEYLKTPLTAKLLRDLLKRLDIPATELLRRKEKVFREVCPTGELSNAEALQLMVDYPALLERPIVATSDQAVIGRPPENVLALI